VPSVSVADNALIAVAPAVDGILAVVTSFAVGGLFPIGMVILLDLHLLLLYCL
jgi:hypothetical protein